MRDLISRQAAIDAIDEYIEKNRRPDFIGNMVWVSGVADAMRIVSDLPSVQPEITKRTAETEQNVPNSELISKKAAIDTVQSMYKRCDTGDITDYRDMMYESIICLPSVQLNMSGYSDRLWKLAYERGKRDAQPKAYECLGCYFKKMEGAEDAGRNE